MASLERFLISGHPSILTALLDILERDPETAVHSVTRDNQAEPERLVISIDPKRAAAMRAALGSLIIIEPDSFLDI